MMMMRVEIDSANQNAVFSAFRTSLLRYFYFLSNTINDCLTCLGYFVLNRPMYCNDPDAIAVTHFLRAETQQGF